MSDSPAMVAAELGRCEPDLADLDLVPRHHELIEWMRYELEWYVQEMLWTQKHFYVVGRTAND